MSKVFSLSVFFTLIFFQNAIALETHLYLNNFQDTINHELVSRPIFNRTQVPEEETVHFHIEAGEKLILNIVNKLNKTVSLVIDGKVIGVLSSGNTNSFKLTIPEGIHYYGLGNELSALSAGAMIVVGSKRQKSFYLKFSECDPSYNEAIHNESALPKYRPEKFMVNDRDFNVNNHHTHTGIEAKVGDSVQIFLYNSSDFMHHAPHFHGFHVLIVKSDANKIYEGLWKDSFGMEPKSLYELLLVPDKEGVYPIHNHNLITTTSESNYPGGMMTHMRINP